MVIRASVNQGGMLLATHESSLHDERGRRRDNFALADVFGVDYQGPAGDESVHGVVYVPHDESLSRQFGYVICFAGKESAVSLHSEAEVDVLCTRSNLTGLQPLNDFALNVDYDSGQPAVTVHHFGQGQAIYISGDVGVGYNHNPYPPLRRFVANLVNRTQPPIAVDAPKAIEVTAARRGPQELMIHLLNNPTPTTPFDTSLDDIKTYFYPEEVNPIHNIRLMFNDFKVKSATLPLSGVSLDVSGDPATVVVPEVKLHEVVIVQLAD